MAAVTTGETAIAEAEVEPAPWPLTAAWVAQCVAGAFEVSSVQELPVKEDGVNSSVSRLLVHFGGSVELVPNAVEYFVKRPARGHSLGVATVQRWYEREHGFYKHVAKWMSVDFELRDAAGALSVAEARETVAEVVPSQPVAPLLRVPCCVASRYQVQENALDFLLVLESLQAPTWMKADPSRGCSLPEALVAVEALGEFHGRFYGRENELRDLRWLPMTPVRLELAPGIQDYYAGAWHGSMKEHLDGVLPSGVMSMCDALCDCYGLLLQQSARPPLTLVHGDFRLENLRFAGTAEAPTVPTVVAAFDWQFVCRGRGAYDFAYFLALAQPPDERRRREVELQERYIAAATRCGAPPSLAADISDDLCVAVLLIMASFVMGAATAPEETMPMHERSLCWLGVAAMDWNASRLLPNTCRSHRNCMATRIAVDSGMF